MTMTSIYFADGKRCGCIIPIPKHECYGLHTCKNCKGVISRNSQGILGGNI